MEIGFLPISIWDLLDIAIVGYLLYQSYRLLRGSIAVNIFAGVVMLIVFSWIVNALNMQLLSSILKQLISTGLIILIIIFQPEVRRFLFHFVNSTLRQRSQFLNTLLDRSEAEGIQNNKTAKAVKNALMRMGKSKTGALIVIAKNANLDTVTTTGVSLKADISRQLLESIFFKNSPLHDGAVVMRRDLVLAAGCILPISENDKLPRSVGLRHRAAVGITESTDAVAFVVSEETGAISFVESGNLTRKLSPETVEQLLLKHF